MASKLKIKVFILSEIIFLSAFLLFLHYSCYRKHKVLYNHVSPYINAKERATLEITGFGRKGMKKYTRTQVIWINVAKEKQNVLTLIDKCSKYLEKNGYPINWQPIRSYNDQYTIFAMPTLERRGYIKNVDKYGIKRKEKTNLVSFMRLFVSLEPLIIIIAPIPMEYYNSGKVIYNASGYNMIFNGWADSEMSHSFLDGKHGSPYRKIWYGYKGFSYGTTFPYHEDIKWFSPELDVLPQELDIVSDTERRIKVDWGWLVFKRERVKLTKDKNYRYDGEGGTYYEDCWKVYAQKPDYYH